MSTASNLEFVALLTGFAALEKALSKPKPAEETRALLCPLCGRKVPASAIREYDGGIDHDTGYHDCGEQARCACGWRGDAEDLYVDVRRG